ncbi:MAG: ISKra4 family transposase [Anaerolineae bacterium]
MNEDMAQAISRMIVADIAGLVKRAGARARQGQVVALAAVEEEMRPMMRQWAGSVLGAVAAAMRKAAELEVRCECGRLCRYKGEQERQQETLVGRLRYRRGYYYCPQCGKGRYPLDEAMAVESGQFSRGLQEAMALQGTVQAFEAAAQQVRRMVGVVVSANAVERVTEGCGMVLERQYKERRERLLSGDGLGTGDSARAKGEAQQWVVELDAAKAHFRDDWHEVKVGVVCVAEPMADEQSEEEVRVRAVRPSYAVHVGSMEDAGAKLYAEAIRRGVRPWQETVVCLADGAPANWNQFALHFPRRVEILDWFHAMEHLWAAGRAGLGEGSDRAKDWVKAQEELLWQGHSEAVIQAIEALAEETGVEAIGREARYFRTNQERIHYDRWREQGYPIGSGAVESACKRLGGARLKGPGMRWTAAGAQAVLNLCAALAAGRWEQDWPLAAPLPNAA